MSRIAALVVSAFLASAQAGIDPGAASAAIDALMAEEMRTMRIPGAAVAVVENGRVVVERAYGIANLETGTPVETDSVFLLASITKQFTAAAIMMLVEEGKVRLDDPLSVYVSPTPPAWERITIRHLLTHTSGLDIAAIPRPLGSAPLRVTKAQAFEFIAQQRLQWPTGRVGWYSDAGYFLLGMVVEKASGQTYHEFLERRVLQPLQMTATRIADSSQIVNKRVSMYGLRGGEHINWRLVWDYELGSFAGISSTLQDLARWDASLRRPAPLKPSSLEQIWTPAKLENGQNARVLDSLYGFGWELADVRGRPTVGHGGGSGTYILRFVDEPLTIIVLTNLEAGSGERHHKLLARAIAGVVRPQYRPPHMLSPRDDPDPDTTRQVAALFADIGAKRVSAAMSDAYRAWYASDPGAQAWYARQLGGVTALKYLAHDDLAGRSIWGGEPLDRMIHYVAEGRSRPLYLSVAVTRDRRVAALDYYSR